MSPELELTSHVQANVNRAIKNALSHDEYKKKRQMERNLAHTRRLDRTKYCEELVEIRANPAYILTSSPHEYHAYMRYLSEGNGNLDDRTMHEWAHFWSAKEEGFEPILAIYFVRNGRPDEYIVQPSLFLDGIPEEMTEEKFFAAVDRIAAAPEELSDSDLEWLAAVPVPAALENAS